MHARAVIEYDLFQRDDQPANITRFTNLVKTIEPGYHVAFRQAVAHKDADLLMAGWHRVLKHGAQFFVELFAGTHTAEFDLDILIRPEPGQQDQVSGQVDDLHRLTHVQDANLAALADDSGLQHQLAGLRDGHEEAPHLGMRHGYRTACRYLSLEDRDDAAVGAEDISEAHGHVLGATVLKGLQQEFGYAFGRAHDAGGPHGLVRRDHHEIVDAVLVG